LLPERNWFRSPFIPAGTLADDQPNPIDDPNAGVTERVTEVAEFQVSVGVYETGQEGDVAQVGYVFCCTIVADGSDSLAFDCDHTALDWRLVNGKYDAGTQRDGHRPIVAEFALSELCTCWFTRRCFGRLLAAGDEVDGRGRR
jgi:hypothetical protein